MRSVTRSFMTKKTEQPRAADPAVGSRRTPAGGVVVPPGFDPTMYRWCDRPECARGECARGFHFHALGLQRGQQAHGKQHARAAEPCDSSRTPPGDEPRKPTAEQEALGFDR